jgi:alpha-tubulin suppressor-like RCC1 family protein
VLVRQAGYSPNRDTPAFAQLFSNGQVLDTNGQELASVSGVNVKATTIFSDPQGETLFIKRENNSMEVMGVNAPIESQYRIFGLESPVASAVPIAAPAVLNDATDIVVGRLHSLARLSNGDVYGWGNNNDSTITFPNGDGNVTSPTLIDLPGSAIGVAVGLTSSFAVMGNGQILSWGRQDSGVLGRGAEAGDTHSPAPVETSPGAALTNAVTVIANFFTAYALRSDGTVYFWGGESTNFATAIRSAANIKKIIPSGISGGVDLFGLDTEGNVFSLSQLSSSPITLPIQMRDIISRPGVALGIGVDDKTYPIASQ